jgi:hypothetical protein
MKAIMPPSTPSLLDSFNDSGPWLSTADLSTIALRLALSVVFGLAIAIVYRASHGGKRSQQNGAMFATLILLCIFISMVSMVIGNSVAKAFSLVGALSIVRFRTVVDDTRDTAFVVFAVITGMAMGAGSFAVPLIGVPLASAVAIAIHYRNVSQIETFNEKSSRRMQLILRMSTGKDIKSITSPLFDNSFDHQSFIESSTTKQGASIEMTYRVVLRDQIDPVTLVASLYQLDGVQSVELKSLYKE